MKNDIESHYQANKDRLRIRDEAVNGSWLAINRGPLTYYAYRRLRNWEDSEDAVQEAYTRALSFSNSFKEGGSLENWLFIVLTNVINQMVNQKSSAPEMVEADDDNISSELVLAEPEQPFHIAILSEQEDRLRSVCSKLSERDCSILALYFKYGHSAPDVAKIIGAKLATVHRVLHENRRKVRR